MKTKPRKDRKWIVDVLLVVVIIAMALFIYYRVTQRLENRNPSSTEETLQATNESISESTGDPVEDEIEQTTQVREEDEAAAQAALDFRLESLEGEIISLSDFVGTPVMVNFWATWCPPCRAEMPLIQEFAADNQETLIVLAVNAGEEGSTVENFVTTQGFEDLIFLLDPTNSVASLYRVPGFPTSLFIDQEGFLQAAHIGELDRELLGNYLDKIGVK